MKVAVVDNGAVSVKNLPPPEIGNGGILVRMESCGICGSDVEKVFGSYSKPSTKLGHEPAGTVLEVGPDVLGIKGDIFSSSAPKRVFLRVVSLRFFI